MKGVNRVIIIGTLGRDPEVRYAANGNAITSLSVATSETWNDKATGEKQEKTEWHRVVIFGKLAEIAGQYLTKGSQVYLEGKLQTRKWQDQTGQDRYSTEVVLDFNGVMQMLGGGQRANQGQGGYGDSSFDQAPPRQAPAQNMQGGYAQPQVAPQGMGGQPAQQGGYGAQPAQGGYAQPQQSQAYQPNDFDDNVPF